MNRSRGEAVVALAFFAVLALMVIPLPSFLLDGMLAFSLTIAILILMLAIYVERPLDFSVFPPLLLMVTLLRLSLNVASTRLILLDGASGPGAAGNVIQAFGNATVGGNTLVGIVVFAIFVVINFVVITKGAGRIAEVGARFTLDAMPGKQMAIDADLNQGAIDDNQARQRRLDIQREADFYGSMDGASKFVRGDAIAGLLILAVNIIGGLSVGVAQEGMALVDALQTYTTLTVGDGLVSQVPALIVSTASGIVVSRTAGGAPFAEELREQVILQPRPMGIAGGVLLALSLAPGLPFVPFALLGGGCMALSRNLLKEQAAEAIAGELEPAPPVDEETDLRRIMRLDELELEIGYGLVPLVDPDKGGELLSRIRAMRKQLATELGFLVPLIHIRDNMRLEPGGYSILLRGNRVGTGLVQPGRFLALGSGDDVPSLPGDQVQDPAFGLPAVWISERERERASAGGYAVVDPSAAVATHLSETIRRFAAELLTRGQVRELLDEFAANTPKVVDEIVPGVVSVSLLHRTLRALLQERIPIRDLGTILETLAEYAPKIEDSDLLTDLVRERLGRTVTAPFLEANGSLEAITIDPDLDRNLRESVRRTDNGSVLALEPGALESFTRAVQEAVNRVGSSAGGRGPVVLCSQALRSVLSQMMGRLNPAVAVIAYNELPRDIQIIGKDVVRVADAH